MNTWAVLAAKEAVIASGLSAGAVPGATIDGFAIGAVLSGACMLMTTSPRRGRRRMLAAAAGGGIRPGTRRRNALAQTLGDASREIVMPPPGTDESGSDHESGSAAPERQDSAGPERRESAGPERRESAGRDYQSRHRLSDHGPGDKQQESRSKPRHAAPAASFSSRMTRHFVVRTVASGVHG